MSPKKETPKAAKSTPQQGFSEEERAAMKERARELKKTSRGNKADGESEVLAKIDELPEPDRSMARRLHAIIQAAAPSLTPRTWYGMPAYARGARIVCFFQSAQKFKTRYATLGFSDAASLDDGSLWPVAYALKELNESIEAKIAALVTRAAS